MRRYVVLAACSSALLLATSFDGATTHLGAFFLRLTAVIAAVFVWPRSPAELPRSELVAPALAVAAIVITAFALPPYGTAMQPLLSVALVVLFYLALRLGETQRTGEALHVFLVAGTGQAVWALLQTVTGDGSRARGGFFNPNDLAAFIAPLAVWAVAVALARARDASTPRWQLWLPASAAALTSAATLATRSRSGLLALGAGLLLLTWGRSRRLALAIGAGLLVLALAVPSLRQRWQTGSHDPFAYSRVSIWRASAEVALANPLGVGLGGFDEAMRVHGVALDGGWLRYPKLAHHAHSEPLNAWVELGWLGLLASLAAPVMIALGLWRSRARRPRERTFADAGVLAALALPAAVSASLHVPPIALLAAAWAAGVMRELAAPEDARLALPRGGGRHAVAAAGLAILVAALPGLVDMLATHRALELRDGGRAGEALAPAELAQRVAPWSVGTALLVESLRHATGEPPLDVVERLMSLADDHPHDVRPVDRGARLVEALAARQPEKSEAWLDLLRTLRAEAARRDPRDAMRWVQLGDTLARAGASDEARAAYERAIHEEPNCAPALAALAEAAARAGDVERARQLARRALAGGAHAARYGDLGRRLLTLDEHRRARLRALAEDG